MPTGAVRSDDSADQSDKSPTAVVVATTRRAMAELADVLMSRGHQHLPQTSALHAALGIAVRSDGSTNSGGSAVRSDDSADQSDNSPTAVAVPSRQHYTRVINGRVVTQRSGVAA